MRKCDLNKAAKQGCSPLNLLYIFRTYFPKNTSEGLLLSLIVSHLCERTFNLCWDTNGSIVFAIERITSSFCLRLKTFFYHNSS